MTKAERERLLKDKWPKVTEKDMERFMRGVKKAARARIFDFDDKSLRSYGQK